MKFMGPMLVVRDMERAKNFYQQVLGCEILADFGANVTMSGGFSLQEAGYWLGMIHKGEADLAFGGHDAELYFETEELDDFAKRLAELSPALVHPMEEAPWGQRALRFYDPDKHMVEVAETLAAVAGRFMQSGMSAEETAKRMDIPLEYLQSLL